MAARRIAIAVALSGRRHLVASSSTSFSSSASSSLRTFSSTSFRHAITPFTMPAMSPTMTSGGVASWKVKEGDVFSAGDVLLEIETDKATMDVEAQDEGVLAKIVVQDGTKDVSVGKVIAVLAEEGDDISNVEAPKEDEAQATTSSSDEGASKDEKLGQEAKSSLPPTTQTGASTASAAPGSSASHHSSIKGPVFPSVQRLIAENNIHDAESKIKGTGIRGMITKGDVLAFLGKAKTPTGTFKEAKGGIAVLGPNQASPKTSAASKAAGKGDVQKAASEPLSGSELRSLIIGGLAAAKSVRKTWPAPLLTPAEEPVAAPKKLVTRKDGIRSDDPLWSLF